VKGPLERNAVYQQLAKHIPRRKVKGNFFKYLVDKRGVARELYTKKTDVLSLAVTSRIEELLDEPI